MSTSDFRFKKFSIRQNPDVMKVGTDGVLLGAWINTENKKKVLDIGCGTGIIALMIAQRIPNACLTCIDISKKAIETTRYNFGELPVECKYEILHSPLQEFKTKELFDLIVCNPPFFNVTSQSPLKSRNSARQKEFLDFNELLKCTAELLHPKGIFGVIIPFGEETNFCKLAMIYKLRLHRKCTVFPTPDLPAKRVLLEFGFAAADSREESLIIEDNGRHQYSDAYKSLTGDFYLSF